MDESNLKRGSRDIHTMKKAPQAPKRFKSSYILFFTAKQDQIKRELGTEASASDVAKKASEMWKSLLPNERAHWEEEARKDKERYTYEKANYRGPWHVVKNPNRRTKKDPSAPKRNPSAFLLFCQERRPEIKARNKGLKTTEITCILGEIWRNQLPDADKKVFVEREALGREKYKKDMGEWKKRQIQQKLIQETEEQNSINISVISDGHNEQYARSAWEHSRLSDQTVKCHTLQQRSVENSQSRLPSQADRYKDYYSTPLDPYNENYCNAYPANGMYSRPNPQLYRNTITSREDKSHNNKYDYVRSREQMAGNMPPSMRSYQQSDNVDYYYRTQYPTHAHHISSDDRAGNITNQNGARSLEVGDYEPFPI